MELKRSSDGRLAPGEDPVSRATGWRSADIFLGLLSVLYSIALGAALLSAAAAWRQPGAEEIRSALLRHSLQYGLVAVLCASALLLRLRRSRLARESTILAACLTALVGMKAFASVIITGFHLYNLVEPTVVLPSVGFILWKLAAERPSRTGSEGVVPQAPEAKGQAPPQD
jgi:hypothetical protein